MAVIQNRICDFDAEQNEDVQEFTFSVNGKDYTVDLSVYARQAFEKAVEPFVTVATVVEPKATTKGKADGLAPKIREWAKKKGLNLAERGRIPQEIIDQYTAEVKAEADAKAAEDAAAVAAALAEAEASKKPTTGRKTAAAKTA